VDTPVHIVEDKSYSGKQGGFHVYGQSRVNFTGQGPV